MVCVRIVKKDDCKIYVFDRSNTSSTNKIRGSTDQIEKFNYTSLLYSDLEPKTAQDIPDNTIMVRKNKKHGLDMLEVFWVQDSKLMSGYGKQTGLEDVVHALQSIGQTLTNKNLLDKVISKVIFENQIIQHDEL